MQWFELQVTYYPTFQTFTIYPGPSDVAQRASMFKVEDK